MKSFEFILKNSIHNITQYIPNTHLGIVCVLSTMLIITMMFAPSEKASAEKTMTPIALSLPNTVQQQTSLILSTLPEPQLTPKPSTDPEEPLAHPQKTLDYNKSHSANKTLSKTLAQDEPVIPQKPLNILTKPHHEQASTQSTAPLFLAHEMEELITTSLPKSSTTTPKPTKTKQTWESYQVKKGDNLSLIFQQVGLGNKDIAKVMSGNKKAQQLTKIYPGQLFDFKIVDGDLQAIRFDKNRLHQIEFHKTDNGFKEQENITKPDIKLTYRSATITSSLFLDGVKAGISENIIMELAGIFAWDIDFALDIRKNDTLHILHEEMYIGDEKIGTGKILAAQVVNKNKPIKAVHFTDSQGHSQYYTPEGKSMRKAFLRSPVDFARISSHFNLQRKHPVLNRIRAHKGTDYAAATGTPIRAAGRGKVTFVGTKGGYGRTIIIQHNRTYKTLYAHMSKYHSNIKNGTRVQQGQVIGYVGSSGLATGPHLHYEFHVNNTVKDPVTVDLPTALPVPEAELVLFKTQTQALMLSFNEHLNNSNQHATAEELNKNINTN